MGARARLENGKLNLATLANAVGQQRPAKQSSSSYKIRLGKVWPSSRRATTAAATTSRARRRRARSRRTRPSTTARSTPGSTSSRRHAAPLRASLHGKGGATHRRQRIAAKNWTSSSTPPGASCASSLPTSRCAASGTWRSRPTGRPTSWRCRWWPSRRRDGSPSTPRCRRRRRWSPGRRRSMRAGSIRRRPSPARRTATCASTPAGAARARTGRSI